MNVILERISEYVKSTGAPVYSAAVIGDGIPLESADFIKSSRCHNSYSVAKAFCVTAFGIAYDRGLITPGEPVAKRLGKYMPKNIDERWLKITYDDVMLHKIGMPSGFLDIDVACAGEFGDDYLGYLFSHPFDHEPGTKRCYTDAAYYLISRAVEEACGEPIDNLLWRELFYPMGFAEAAWSRCPQGHPIGATGLYISTRDMVKLGELYRRGGVYENRRLVSSEWTSRVISAGYELRPTGVGDSFAKGGMYGQYLLVMPSRGVSVAVHSFGSGVGDRILHIVSENADT